MKMMVTDSDVSKVKSGFLCMMVIFFHTCLTASVASVLSEQILIECDMCTAFHI